MQAVLLQYMAQSQLSSATAASSLAFATPASVSTSILYHRSSLFLGSVNSSVNTRNNACFRAKYPYHKKNSRVCFNSLGRTVVSSSATSTVLAETNVDELVDTLLSMVQGTDRGVNLKDAERECVNAIVEELEQRCIREPLKSPLVFGEWDVEYSSNPTSTGGYFRSAFGRMLLKTQSMEQVLRAPDFVMNKVAFRAFNQINGEVSLEGRFTPLSDDTIKVTFNPPKFVIGPFNFQFDRESSVEITILYLDAKIRVGRGSKGSILIFRRRNV